jgi:hypothetical protein
MDDLNKSTAFSEGIDKTARVFSSVAVMILATTFSASLDKDFLFSSSVSVAFLLGS